MDDEAIKEALERFKHVPYYLAQTAMGVEDGGYASLYDSQAGGDFDGKFSNEIGGDMMAYVLGRVGKREFAEGSLKLFDMEAMNRLGFRLPDDATEADFQAAAERIADATVEHVTDCFPSVGNRWLENDRIRIRDFVLAYMRAEARVAEAFESDAPMP